MRHQLILLLAGLTAISVGIMQIVNPNRAPLSHDAIDFGLKRFGCLRLFAGALLILFGLWLVWAALKG